MRKNQGSAAAEVLGVSAIWLLTEHNNISVETEKDPATGGEVLEDDLRHYAHLEQKKKPLRQLPLSIGAHA